jgi:hypothetical protein
MYIKYIGILVVPKYCNQNPSDGKPTGKLTGLPAQQQPLALRALLA